LERTHFTDTRTVFPERRTLCNRAATASRSKTWFPSARFSAAVKRSQLPASLSTCLSFVVVFTLSRPAPQLI